MSDMSRSIVISRGVGSSLGGGGQSTSRTLSKIYTFEEKGRVEHIDNSASNSHTVNISRFIHQFSGATGGGKKEQKMESNP